MELYCLNDGNQGKGINISSFTITDLDGQDTILNDTNEIILHTGEYAVIHWTEGIDETTEIGDINENGYIDVFTSDYGLTATDDQIALRNETGSILDAVCWSNQDETWSTYNINDVQTLKDHEAWKTANTTILQTDCVNISQKCYSKGSSIGRINLTDTNSKHDFKTYKNPTPGKNNTQAAPQPQIKIEIKPAYIPKIPSKNQHSIPFAIQTQLSNFTPLQEYQLKAYVTGNLTGSTPATQTWNGGTWEYSNYYTTNITTDQHGNCSKWLYLRFKRDYMEYQRNIKNNSEAYLKVKYRNASASQETTTPVSLLNLDATPTNETAGGYIIGRTKKNNSYLQNKLLIIENQTQDIINIYRTENNYIDEQLPSLPGYYKIPAPTGSPYTIQIVDHNLTPIKTIQNITVKQGFYDITVNTTHETYYIEYNETKSIPVNIINTGDFNDTIRIQVNNNLDTWNVTTETNQVTLNAEEEKTILINVHPTENTTLADILHLNLSCTSIRDPGITTTTIIKIKLRAPDLCIKQATAYDQQKQERTTFGQGEILRVKATAKNQGNQKASAFNVSFILTDDHQKINLGKKHYESIENYPKYPAILVDTKHIPCGDYNLHVLVDEDDHITEADEDNNIFTMPLQILDTSPSTIERKIMITELYYHTHPNINNEFITIHNPTSKAVDISNWYITDDPERTISDQPKIIFPAETILKQNSSITATQNATAFHKETGTTPQLEYQDNSSSLIPQMKTHKTMVLNNEGEILVLKTPYNHTIDLIAYGNAPVENSNSWHGSPINESGIGVILKRTISDDQPIDTNSSQDWNNPRIFTIGQSDFPLQSFTIKGNATLFVSPDSTYTTLVKALEKAKESLFLNMYEFTSPPLCRKIRNLLARNITVNILMEGSPVGGVKDEEIFILHELHNLGAKIHMLKGDQENNIFSRYSFDHAKYSIIDNKTVILHTANWGKTGVPKNNTFGNREWGIIIRNTKVANYFTHVFFEDWNIENPDVHPFEECKHDIPDDFILGESTPFGTYKPIFKSQTVSGNFTVTPILSPDTSEKAICSLINSAEHHIYVEQLYIHKQWDTTINPFLQSLVNQSRSGITIKVILNCNPEYISTQIQNNLTKKYLQQNEINVKFIYTNSSCFTNVHTKGIIIDNKSVLISSINWNENSVRRNRETGVIVENTEAAEYYANVFLHDWNYKHEQPSFSQSNDFSSNVTETFRSPSDYKNQVCITAVFTITIFIIVLDWRKRTW